uniref:Cytochrome c oxidase subunit 2 n=1 Tax=Bathysciadiidae sp. MNHN-IM-2013-40843 TaxID=2496596 RepID=A0A6B7FPM8_9GAST|nr:cytochrome c oxidase subunit II [Bathysciadiidae sp. MNHN-IM-2013-40843]
MASWSQLGFQDSCSPLLEELSYFHDHAMVVVIMIISSVFYVFGAFLVSSMSSRNIFAQMQIETVWTILPSVFLFILALPSLRLLYVLDEVGDSQITVKVVGYQWYWAYEYSDFKDLGFESYMSPSNVLSEGDFRLLDVDNRLVIPIHTCVRVLVTSGDVIHAWAIPSLGVKVDAVPGRLNQTSFFISEPGVFYGQCSEICGANHSNMPTVVEGVKIEDFVSWMVSKA